MRELLGRGRPPLPVSGGPMRPQAKLQKTLLYYCTNIKSFQFDIFIVYSANIKLDITTISLSGITPTLLTSLSH